MLECKLTVFGDVGLYHVIWYPFSSGTTVPSAPGLPNSSWLHDHAVTHTTLDRTPLDEYMLWY